MNTACLEEIQIQQEKSKGTFSSGWEKWDNLLMKFLGSMGEALIRDLQKENALILDVAAGTGEPGLSIACNHPSSKVIGLDLSEGMLRAAQLKAKTRELSNYETVTGSACELPFPQESFDALVCRLGIMFFPDPVKACIEFKRILKPGSALALSVWGPSLLNEWLSPAVLIVKEKLAFPTAIPEAPGVFRFAEKAPLSLILETTGFTNITYEELPGNLSFSSPEVYVEMICDIVGFIKESLKKVDAQTQKETKDAILAFAREKAEDDGTLHLKWNAWIIRATT
ncbi:MAG: ubiquinone/menaquinone biosynthesis C-methylase UbiE [Halioglobus sp.]|jgi:ubiquinone/menaquinone biosynthesis C-methylase UbiE